MWACATRNLPVLKALHSPDEIAGFKRFANKTESEVLEAMCKNTPKIQSFRILRTKHISDDEVSLTVELRTAEGLEEVPRIKLKKIDGEWRLNGRG
jgi:hypothetical protein